MNEQTLREIWQHEEQQPFTGWDFSYLAGRMIEEQPPWSYSARASALMQHATAVVDLDTGGAENFLALKAHWPAKVVATESYPPNLQLATQRLAPLNVPVIAVELSENGLLPFTDSEFDLVLNRHSAFNPLEIARSLATGGTFLTQQVHGLWAADLLAAFDRQPQWPGWTLESCLPKLQAAGLAIITAEDWSGKLTFTDVGAIVYYLKAVPWNVPGFSVQTHFPTLLKLQHQLEADDGLVFTARKFWIEARKS
jgi:SAM-dependent methyltransferase